MLNERLHMIKPLTKKNKKGDVYTRPKTVEENIESAIGLDIESIRARLKEEKSDSENYLKSECLVYLFRESRIRHDNAMINLLATALLARCDLILKAKLPQFSEQLREDILAEFAEILADGTNNNLDYYEVRFNRAFRTHRLEKTRTEINQNKRFVPTAFGTTMSDDQEEAHSDEPLIQPTESDNLIKQELLDQLPTQIQKAVVLRSMGYPIESNDPTENTVAKLCGVSARTIHNWITEAQNILNTVNKEPA